MKVRGKFVVQGVEKTNWGGTIVRLGTQYDPAIPEDQRFAKATPSGRIEMTVDNPSAAEFLELGKAFYVDFVRLEDEAAAS